MSRFFLRDPDQGTEPAPQFSGRSAATSSGFQCASPWFPKMRWSRRGLCCRPPSAPRTSGGNRSAATILRSSTEGFSPRGRSCGARARFLCSNPRWQRLRHLSARGTAAVFVVPKRWGWGALRQQNPTISSQHDNTLCACSRKPPTRHRGACDGGGIYYGGALDYGGRREGPSLRTVDHSRCRGERAKLKSSDRALALFCDNEPDASKELARESKKGIRRRP